MPVTAWLDELDRSDLARTGGKGANLGEMVSSGLPVPPGFVVLTDAYRAFVTHSGLHDEVLRLAQAASDDDVASLEEKARDIRSLFEAGTIPSDINLAIVEAYETLGGGPVAVRSSATAEDLPGASFAGQHDSFLNIVGTEAVCAAVRRCWASLWNPQALAYRRRRQMHLDDVAIAVVVQRMIEAERAGVLFTANPLNHRRDQMLLSASWGLGEALVGGEVDPDQWVVDSESGRILETHIADKQLITVKEKGGTKTREMPDHLRKAPTLNDDEVERLIALGNAAASFFGDPQDIEWAWADDGTAYLVQSRPITTLFPLPKPLPNSADGLRLYLSLNVHAQQMVEPLTTAGLEWWRVLMGGFAYAATRNPHVDVSWYKVGARRMFIDATELLRKRKRWSKLGEALSEKDPITTEAMLAFARREGDAIINKGRGFRIPLRMVPLVLRLGYRTLLSALSPARQRNRLLRETDEAIRVLNDEASRIEGVSERVSFIENKLARRGAVIWLIPVAVMWPGLLAESALKARLKRWFGDASALRPIQRALPHNPTTEMGLELWRLAGRLMAEGAEPSANHPAVKTFLAQYGHRTLWEIDPGVARWSEDPSYILEVLRGYMYHNQETDQEKQFQEHFAEAQVAAEALIGKVRSQKGRIHAWITRRLIRLYREMAGLREQPKFDGARMIALARQILHGAGQELVEQGRLDDPEDVFFLTFAELRRADSTGDSDIDLRDLATKARDEYRRELERRAVPRLMTSTGECIFGVATEEAEGVLTGVPVSPGVYEGRVRIIFSPVSDHLDQGEVMVCQGTDPAWTPLFLSTGALVMETGGAVSHGSVVAREYGLPAVAGVQTATEQLQNGMRVRVNGETGEVKILDG